MLLKACWCWCWRVCAVFSCPSPCFHSPSRPLHRGWRMLPQCHRKLEAVACTLQRAAVSPAGEGDFHPSCTGRLCLWTSPVYCWGEHPGICTLPPPQCPKYGIGGDRKWMNDWNWSGTLPVNTLLSVRHPTRTASISKLLLNFQSKSRERNDLTF